MQANAASRAATAGSASAGETVHVPIRQCVGCRTRAAKRILMRFVRIPDAGWRADPAARLAGRGAYVCSKACKEKLVKNKRYRGLVEVDWPEEPIGR